MKFLICSCLSLILLCSTVKANDSTNLYNKRVEKLKELSNWLFNNANNDKIIEGAWYQYDSAQNKNWPIFDQALTLFFNKRVVDSLIQNQEGQNNIFTPDDKTRIFKSLLARFNALSHRVDTASLNFMPQTFDKDYTPSQKDKVEAKNSIIQYFVIEDDIVEYLRFAFDDGKSQLLWIGVSEPQGSKGEKLTKYYETLKRKL